MELKTIYFFFILKSIARQIRPNTLRALFGDNLAQNGVHCSDLEENCIFETDFFFNIPCN